MSLRYWKGVVIPEELAGQCQSEIEQLKAGHLKSLCFEKLNISNEILYSVRVNISDRLILTEQNGILIVLDFIQNHDYEGNKFLKNKNIKHYLEHKLGLSSAVIDTEFSRISEEELTQIHARLQKDNQEKTFIELHGDKWVELTETQSIPTYSKMPMMVFGPGGSGKSTIALSILLERYLSNQRCSEELPCLYLSQSDILVDEMKKQFKHMQPHHEESFSHIQFKTIQQLCIELFKISPEQLVSFEHFKSCWQNHLKPKKNIAQSNSLWKDLIDKETEEIFEEMAILASCGDGEYLQLGQRESLFPPPYRPLIIDVYDKYQKLLRDSQLLSIDLLNHSFESPAFSIILLDEAQNLPPVLAQLISRLAYQQQIAFFSGEQQVIHRKINNYARIKSYFHTQGITLSEYHLTKTHRCSHQVAQFTNQLMQLKRQVVGGTSLKGELTELSAFHLEHNSIIRWIQASDIRDMCYELQFESADFAIVTLDPYVEEIRTILPKAVIFTVAEAQGLGFKNLMVYKVLANELYEVIFSGLSNKDTKNRGLRAQLNRKYTQDFDLFITAVMRAEGNLTIVQDSPKKSLKDIKSIFEPFLTHDSKLSNAAESKTTESDWESQAHYYLKNRLQKQAEFIWCHILNRSQESLYGITVTPEKNLKKTLISDSHLNKSDQEFLAHWRKKTNPSLNELLNHKRAAEFLMNPIENSSECLFDYILQDKHLNKQLVNLQNPNAVYLLLQTKNKISGFMLIDYIFHQQPTTLAQMLSTDIFLENFYKLNLLSKERIHLWLSYPDAGIAVIEQMMRKKFSKKIKNFIELIIDNANPPHDALHILSHHPKGVEILKVILGFHQKLFHSEAFLDALCFSLPESAKQYAHTSALFWLSKIEWGAQRFLYDIYKLHPDLFHSPKFIQALCRPIAESAPKYALSSPLYELLKTELGLSLVMEIYSKAPEQCQTPVFVEALYRSIKTTEEAVACASPVQLLAQTPTGFIFANQLYTDNLSLINNEFFIESLCQIFPQEQHIHTSGPLYSLTQNQAGAEVLLQIYHQNAHQFHSNNFMNVLCHIHPVYKCSPLFFIAVYANTNINILNILINFSSQKPELFTNPLFVEALCQSVSELAGHQYHLRSALFYLIRNDIGLKLLSFIYAIKPELFHTEIFINALCRNSSEHTIDSEALYSPLFFFSKFRTGKILLNQMYKDKPHLFHSEIFLNALCFTEPAHGISPLFLFQQQPNVQINHILNSMLTNQAQLLNHKQLIKGLCTPISNTKSEFLNTTPLFWMINNPDGFSFIQAVYDLYPQIFHTPLLIEALCHFVSPTAQHDAFKSPLFFLCYKEEGVTWLLKLFDHQPELFNSSLIIQTLCQTTLESDEVYPLSSALYWLMMSPKGFSLIKKLFDTYPKLFNTQQFIESLCISMPFSNKIYSQTSGLYFLLASDSGISFLHELFLKYPQLFYTQAFIDELLLPQASKIKYLKSTLYWLTYSTFGVELMLKMISISPKLFQSDLFINALCFANPENIEHDSGISPLYCLCSQPKGVEFLNTLYHLSPKLFHSDILMHTLCKEVSENNSSRPSASALFGLCYHEQGTELLQKMFEKSPALFYSKHFLEGLCRIIPADSPKFPLHTALFMLIRKSKKTELLLNIYEKFPSLFHSDIFMKALCCHLDSPDPKLLSMNGLSVMFCLSLNHGGIFFLHRLYSEVPHLFATEQFIEAICYPFDLNQARPLFCFLIDKSLTKEHFLFDLYQQHPYLFLTEQFMDALCQPIRYHPIDKNQSSSALFWLTLKTYGIDFLIDMYHKNPLMFQSPILISALCKPYFGISDDESMISSLAHLSKYEPGRHLLKTMIDRHNSFKLDLIKHLYQIPQLIDTHRIIQSNLNGSELGQELANHLFTETSMNSFQT